MSNKKIILTGERPTGRLHLGHFVGTLKNRIKIQEEGNYDEMYIMIADSQALTDNADNPEKIRENIIEVALDYLSIGLDPKKVTIFLQSQVSALTELTFYYSNLVTVSRLQRNPTVKNEIKMKNFEANIPAGFFTYPISQAADITAFKANIVPVGEDQLPMIEQTREIVRSFNRIYQNILIEPEAVLPENKYAYRLPGIDGSAKMSKSLGNGIYLADTKEELKKKVMSMYTDPKHIHIEDPGNVENNIVFIYLDVFATNEDFKKYLPEYNNLDELKAHYQKGGLGDVTIKKFLLQILENVLEPIHEKRSYFEARIDEVYEILKNGSEKASQVANKTLKEVKDAMAINYFEDADLIQKHKEKYENL